MHLGQDEGGEIRAPSYGEQVDRLASAAGAADAAAYARAIVPVNIIRAMLPHASVAQRDALREPIAALT